MAWTSLCTIDELTEGQGKYVEISGFELAVFLKDGNTFVLDNYCPHAGGNLSAGFVDSGCAVCPWHYWSFNLETGMLNDNSGMSVRAYKVRLFPRENHPTLVQADLPIY